MSRVGVGVPTRNRSALLRKALICLRDQTERDIEVLVLDNASTDDTPQAFQDVVGDDPRFRYRRQDSMVPMVKNFLDAFEGVSGDYFLWRADDDLSALNYIECLADQLDTDRHADLAVAPFKTWYAETDKTEVNELAGFPEGDAIDRAVFLLRCKQPTWFYGLWRRSALRTNLAPIGTRYPYTWGWDHVPMAPAKLAGRVTARRDTWFLQAYYGPGSYVLNTADRLAARTAYAAICDDLVAKMDISKDRLPEVRAALRYNVDRCIGPLRRLQRRLLKERVLAALGLKRQ